MRTRKIHLRSVLYKRSVYAHCNIKQIGDLTIANNIGGLRVLDAAQLVWVPIEHQCGRCHRELAAGYPGHGAPDVDYTTCDTHSATPLMLTTIEVVLHAFAAFCVAVDESGTHADRGCYTSPERPVCWCGRVSPFDKSEMHGHSAMQAIGYRMRALTLTEIYKQPYSEPRIERWERVQWVVYGEWA